MPDLVRASDVLVRSQHIVVDRKFYDSRFKIFMDAINNINRRQEAFDATVNDLVSLGLSRLDETLGPLLITLQEAAQLGFLVCKAVGENVMLTVGNPANFVVTEGVDLFTPTPYLLAIDDNDPDNWGVVLVDQWTKQTGDLATHCVFATQNTASTAWNISCNSALPAALADMLADAEAAAASATAADASIAAQLVTLQDALAAIASGPVASVAGRTGVIVLAMDDINGLVDALQSKAANASLTTGLAGKQNQANILTALSALSLAGDRLIYASGANTLSITTFTEFARSLLDDANYSSALSTLGFSTFGKTIVAYNDVSALLSALGFSAYVKTTLDDVDASARLTSLGVSAFIKSLLDDVDAAAARATLGAASSGSVPAKATAAEVSAGTDDAKFTTALGIATANKRINTQAGTAYTIQASDNNGIIRFTSNSAIVCTLPATLKTGFNCIILQAGTGLITFTPAANATRNMPGAGTRTTTQYAQVQAFVGFNGDDVHAIWNLDGSSIT